MDDDVDEQALGQALLDHALFVSGGRDPKAVFLYANCNDLFSYASADAEPVPYAELPRFLASDANRGGRWACLQRKMRPLAETEARWRERGWWDAELDALPERSRR